MDTRPRCWPPLGRPVAAESRQYPNRPFLGVGALLFRDGPAGQKQILLVKRGRPPFLDWWSLPGGIVEAGETLESAVAREVLEETGLTVTADRIATVFERIVPGNSEAMQCEYHYVLIDFWCQLLGGELRPGDDSKEAAWQDVGDLADIQLTAGTQSVIMECCEWPATYPFVTRP